MAVVDAEELFIFYSWCCVKPSLYGTAVTKGPVVRSLDDRRICSTGGRIITGENLRPRSNPCPNASLSNTNLTWTALGVLRGQV